MQYMFYYASRFDQPLDDWNTGDVTDTSHMFHSASDSAYLQIRLLDSASEPEYQVS